MTEVKQTAQERINALDKMKVGAKIEIDKQYAQSYRNDGNSLWRTKSKKFTIRTIELKCYAIRVL